MEFLAFEKMDRGMDEIYGIYKTLGGEKFDTDFRNTRKGLKTLYADLKKNYKEVGEDQILRGTKSEFQKDTMEYKNLNFRIKMGIIRMGKDMMNVEKEITRYCKENDTNNERFYNKLEEAAKKDALGGHESDMTQSFATQTNNSGFDEIHEDMMKSSVNDSNTSNSEMSISHKPSRKSSRNSIMEAKRPKVNKELMNEDELMIQEMVEAIENFETCLIVLIKKEVFYEQSNDSGIKDDWTLDLPSRFQRKVKAIRDEFKTDVIREEDEEYEDSDNENFKESQVINSGGDMEQNIQETKQDFPELKGPPEKKFISKKGFQLSPEDEMAMDMFDELDAKMDDNLKLVSKQLDLLGENLDIAEEGLDQNAALINDIDAGTKALLEDVRDQNKQMKEVIANFREPNKLICDIILIVFLCVCIGLFVFLLKRYFEIKAIIEEAKANPGHTDFEQKLKRHLMLII